jgi:alkylation response protein AidB-like acyl-CoA dehydrogenase
LKLNRAGPETLRKCLDVSLQADNLKAAVMLVQTDATTPDLECGPYSIRHASDGSPETVRRMLADIRELAPVIAGRVAQFDAERRMPMDVVDMLRSMGLFRVIAPRSYGGLEVDLLSAVQVITALARIDGSLGWTAMIGSGSAIFAPLLPRETCHQIYRNGPDVILGGSAAPMGTAEHAAGGWRVTGRWPFASGCLHADWLIGLCVMMDDGEPIPGQAGASGAPTIRGFALPAHEWLIEDTWYVAGLKGTGSNHNAQTDKLVPAANFFDLDGPSCVPGPLYRGLLPSLPLVHGAFAVGMAQGALDDLLAMANTGRQQLRAATAMRDSETFQFELGRVAADVRAIRSVHQAQVAENWQHALAGTLKDQARYVESTQTGVREIPGGRGGQELRALQEVPRQSVAGSVGHADGKDRDLFAEYREDGVRRLPAASDLDGTGRTAGWTECEVSAARGGKPSADAVALATVRHGAGGELSDCRT